MKPRTSEWGRCEELGGCCLGGAILWSRGRQMQRRGETLCSSGMGCEGQQHCGALARERVEGCCNALGAQSSPLPVPLFHLAVEHSLSPLLTILCSDCGGSANYNVVLPGPDFVFNTYLHRSKEVKL